MTYPYVIKTKEDLLKISTLACEEDFPVYISANSTMIDAKSLLALFTILGKEVNLVAPDHVASEKFSQFINKLK